MKDAVSASCGSKIWTPRKIAEDLITFETRWFEFAAKLSGAITENQKQSGEYWT